MSSFLKHLATCRRATASSAALAALLLPLVASTSWSATSRFGAYQYLSPVPGATMVSPLNNIIIRDGRDIDRHSIAGAGLAVMGSTSGLHPGRLVLSDDGRTLVFDPDLPFAAGERVAVTMRRAPLAIGAGALPPLAFDFEVAKAAPRLYVRDPAEDGLGSEWKASGPVVSESTAPPPGTLEDLPAGYPPVTLLVSDHPDPGLVFCTPARNTPPASNNHMMILDNDAMPLFYRRTSSRPVDFRKLPDGRLLYFEIGKRAAYLMDGNYAIVDSFAAGNGYSSDSHDTVILPNNHALLMIHDPQPVDMSLVVPGGDPEATVIGLVLQEIDVAKNVVWQWRSWDHLEITDMSTACASLTDSRVDYIHGNAIEVDFDGNLLISGRYLNEIFKIDRQTGDVLWRFGLNSKRNQFTILNDSFGFSDQHDVRRLPNGHITLFDNHYCIDPKVTRILEYELDEQNLIATLVWEYRHTPDQQSVSGGGYQRRDHGAGMIGWANCTTPPHITDHHPDGSTAWEVQFWAPPVRSLTYRAFRFPWRTTAFTTDVDSLDFGTMTVGDSALLPLVVTNHTSSPITFTGFVTRDTAFSVAEAPPITVDAGGSVTVQVKFRPDRDGPIQSTLYVRSTTATDLIAYSVAVEGVGEDLPTPTLLARFEAVPAGGGIQLRWQFAHPERVASTALARAPNLVGPWTTLALESHETGEATEALDRTVSEGVTYYYRLTANLVDGTRAVFGPINAAALLAVQVSGLTGLAPNPASGSARIDFALVRQEQVRISLVDVIGREVAILADGPLAPGSYSMAWDCRKDGERLPAGVYFVRWASASRTMNRRLVLLP